MNRTPPRAGPSYRKIDHIAFAVRELEEAVKYFTEVLGFTLVRRLEIKGQKSGMLSAELVHGDLKFVLCQGTEPASQVSRLIEEYGPGVAHIALTVDGVHDTVENLRPRGMSFQTSVIEGPGLRQVFTTRDANTGLSFEFIERTAADGFLQQNVQNLFEQLERADAY